MGIDWRGADRRNPASIRSTGSVNLSSLSMETFFVSVACSFPEGEEERIVLCNPSCSSFKDHCHYFTSPWFFTLFYLWFILPKVYFYFAFSLLEFILIFEVMLMRMFHIKASWPLKSIWVSSFVEATSFILNFSLLFMCCWLSTHVQGRCGNSSLLLLAHRKTLSTL